MRDGGKKEEIAKDDEKKSCKTTKGVNITEISSQRTLDSTPGPEVGEIIDEETKVFWNQVDGIIRGHREYAPVYFISVHTQKDPFSINVVRRRWIVRKSCPDPDWNSEVYSYNNKTAELRLEWVLPTMQDSISILKNKHMYDEKLIRFIKDQKEGKLRVPTYAPNSLLAL